MPLPRHLAPLLLAACVGAADQPAFSGDLTAAAVTKVCDAAFAWQVAHPAKHHELDWTHGALYIGMCYWGEQSGNQQQLDHLRTVGARNDWKPHKRPGHADDHCVNQTWLQLHLHDRRPEQFAPTAAVMGAFIDKDPGNLDWKSKPTNRDWAWCDALFMAPPTLAMLYTATGEKRWLDRMDGRWWHTSDYLYDKTESLYFRDSSFFDKKEKNGRKVFWSRGNGWVFAGLVHVLQNMPADYPSRKKYEEQFRQMADKLVTLQTPDGTWHASLLDPENWTIPETSGTAFYTYGLLWGVANGLLTADKHLDPAIKGWKRLTTHVNADGKVGYIQPIGAAPAAVNAESTEVYGVGGFLLAGTEILNRITLEGAKRAPLTVSNSLDAPRLREVTSLPWAAAVKLLPGLTPANVAVRDGQTGHFVPVQAFDADGDGSTDELLFCATLTPKQTRRYELIQVAGAQPKALPSRLHARHVPERKDDFAWENDRMAFRTYGPALAVEGSRGGVDIWCKRTREPVVDRWFKSGKYHDDVGEGCDCYKVGPTMGCGGSGYLDAAGKLTVTPVYATHKLIAAGPLRLAFALTYPAVEVGGAKVVETRRISMDKGESFFRVQATHAVTGDAKGVSTVAGIRTDKDTTSIPAERVATVWVDPEKGPEKNGRIGKGLILPEGVTAKLAHEHVLGVFTDLTKPVTWHAGATWSKALDFTTPESWAARAQESAARFAAPITVTAAN